MRAYLISILFLTACRIDLPEYASDDSLIDAAVIEPDSMPPGDPAMLGTAQADHDFGDVTVDATSGSLQVIVRNIGEQTSSPIALAILDEPDDFDLLVAGTDDCVGITLAPQATCIAEVRFHPATPGAHAARLEVSADDGGTFTLDLTGNGLTPGDLEITAGDPLTFATVEIESMSAVQTLTVLNTGGAATAALDTVLSDETNYTVVTDDCEGVALGAGLSCDVDVRFDPTTVGSLPASVSVRESVSVGVAANATGTGSARLAVGKTGIGTVVSTPSGINCVGAASCPQASFTQTPIQLVASGSDINYVFDSWTGACATETSSTCSVPLTTAVTNVGVVFRALDCTPDTIVCDDATEHYVDCGPTGEVELEMQCPLGCASGMEKCVDVNPSNDLGDYLTMSPTGPNVILASGSTINTDLTTGGIFNGSETLSPTNALVGTMRVYWFNSLSITGDVNVTGANALVVLVNGDVTIAGPLDLSAEANAPGPGFQTGTCVGGASNTNSGPAGGGGGAGKYQTGAAGGFSSVPAAGGSGGTGDSNPSLVPLRGGCAGGRAKAGLLALAPQGAGGAGGGAIQIVSRTLISLTGSGLIDASAGGGFGGYDPMNSATPGPGGGGGSGGGILLEAPQVSLNGAGVVLSTKGGGGGGVGNGANGSDGGTAAGQANGGTVGAAAGGKGGNETLSPTFGAAATTNPGNGAGGGGNVGVCRFNTTAGTVPTPTGGAAIRSRSSAALLSTRMVP